MPTNLVFGETYQVTTIIQAGAQVAYLDRHWKKTASGVVTGTMEDLALAVATNTAAIYKGAIFNACSYRGTICRRVSGAPPFELPVVSTFFVGAGTAGPIGMAKQTAGVVALYANFLGKKFRGRQFVPFPATADDQGQGVPTAGYIAGLGVLGVFFSNPIRVPGPADDTLAPCLWHRLLGVSDLITSYRTRSIWSTQKRRGDYGRANIPPI